MSSQVGNTFACPSCGEINHIEKMGTDAGCLCWKCHYPLFWAHLGEPALTDSGIDRNAVDFGIKECPNCRLINELNAPVCLKCNYDFRPRPVEITPPPPEPPTIPAPVAVVVPPAKRLIWPWVALAVTLVVGLGLLIWLLVATS